MSNLIKMNGLGMCSKDYSAKNMAKTIKSISTVQIDKFKEQVDSKARELSSEITERKIKETVSALVLKDFIT